MLPPVPGSRPVPQVFLITAVSLLVLLSLSAHSWLMAQYQGAAPGAPVPAPPAPVVPPPPPGQQPYLSPPEARPLLAVVIDDLGWGVAGTAETLALPYRLTMAVLPGGPASREEAEAAALAGHEVFLHLPMEPLGNRPPYPKFVTVDMPDGEVRALVRHYLDGLPGVIGVNNHMGSRATADERTMRAVLETIAQRGLIFVDSHTSADSVAAAVARRVGVPYAVNALFLDNDRTPEAVRRRVWEAAGVARRVGQALVIGHVHPVTAAVLAEELPRLEAAGIAIVPASRVVDWDVAPRRPRLP